jgi:hypothetical protein
MVASALAFSLMRAAVKVAARGVSRPGRARATP